MNRVITLSLAGIALLAAGFFAGRWSIAPGAILETGVIPGDRGLEAAWQGLLRQQQASLALMKGSDFYGDDQERAEAHYALLMDLAASITSTRAEGDGVLSGQLPRREQPGQPMTPNGMAALLEQVAEQLRTRSQARLGTARRAFAPTAGQPGEVDAPGMAIHRWNLDNQQALVIEFPPGHATARDVALGNVWAMGLAPKPPDRSQPHCDGEETCRAILSHRNPGQPGWLDTGGHRRGLLVLRWPDGAQAPLTRLVRLADLPERSGEGAGEGRFDSTSLE